VKVLLINPPFYRFMGLEQDYVPLSLLAVGSKLLEEGNTVYLRNMEVGESLVYEGYCGRVENYDKYIESLTEDNIVWKTLEKDIEDIKPDKIGISVLNVKHKSALKIISIADKCGIPVFVGGHHPTILPESYPQNVKVFKGEFESGGCRVEILDELPFPRYDILLDEYSPNGYAHVITARGCPYGCRFCASLNVWGRKVTFKSAPRILREMEYIENTFHCDYFTIWDETFTLNPRRLKEFCSAYSLNSKWRCDTRADTIDEEMIKMMTGSGCGQMSIGIECADNTMLKRIGKHERVEDFKKAAEILNKYNVQWKAYCMLGFPGEKEVDLINTIDFAKSLKPFRITLSFFTPYVGTDLFGECEDLGLIDKDFDFAMHAHQSPHNYFCPDIPRERYFDIRARLSGEVDEYNRTALKTWK